MAPPRRAGMGALVVEVVGRGDALGHGRDADAGEATFWIRSGRYYGKRRIEPREAVVTINASGATLAEAKAHLRAKVDQHLRRTRPRERRLSHV